MRNVLLWLCLALPFLGITQTYQADVIFRLDLNEAVSQGAITEEIETVQIIADNYATALGDTAGTSAYDPIEELFTLELMQEKTLHLIIFLR